MNISQIHCSVEYSVRTVLNMNLLYSEIPSMPDKIHISYLYSDIEPFKAVNVRLTSLFLIPHHLLLLSDITLR